ncbi:hypothetical protein PT974_06847 [Cladobotryum mycophilum]|uniref:Uncharacterized protein n=1 Tax=Cladobotryum mycophilum TaxID=491253 RepID=A0ABR0SMN7_9HYPO
MSVPRRRTAANMNSDRPVYDMELPFDPNTLTQRAQDLGLGRMDAAVFAHVALEMVREVTEKNGGRPVTALQIAEAIREHTTTEARRLEEEKGTKQNELYDRMKTVGWTLWEDAATAFDMSGDPMEALKDLDKIDIVEEEVNGLKRKRFKFNEQGQADYFGGKDPYDLDGTMASLSLQPQGRDLISNICQNIELAVEIGKYLNAEDILNLYRANKAFYHAINSYLMSSVRSWIMHHCPEAARIFNYKLYKKHLVPDPVGRTWAEQAQGRALVNAPNAHKVRSIPGLKYLQLVMGRDRYCREIIAIMARNGHRMPPTMHKSLLRLWLLMEVPTTVQREALLRNEEMWTNYDIYNIQFLFMKLGLHFNDPVYGPTTWDLLHLMMGQKGLYPLWQLLTRKKYKTLSELLELRVRYDFQLPPDHWGRDYFDKTIHNVPFHEVGIGHNEGWGMGDRHLMRPDELIPVEAVARGLELDEHLTHMMMWGYFDWETGENLIPSAQEMYVSDEKVLDDMDTTHHWTCKHVLKKHFHRLSKELQQEIIEDDEDQRLRAMAWCGDEIDDHSSDEEREYTLDDEIDRGFIVPHQDRDHPSQVPSLTDKSGWMAFVDEALIGIVPDISEEEKLRAEAWNNYQHGETDGDWDWGEWLRQEKLKKAAGGSFSGSTETDTSATTSADESQGSTEEDAEDADDESEEVDEEDEEEDGDEDSEDDDDDGEDGYQGDEATEDGDDEDEDDGEGKEGADNGMDYANEYEMPDVDDEYDDENNFEYEYYEEEEEGEEEAEAEPHPFFTANSFGIEELDQMSGEELQRIFTRPDMIPPNA